VRLSDRYAYFGLLSASLTPASVQRRHLQLLLLLVLLVLLFFSFLAISLLHSLLTLRCLRSAMHVMPSDSCQPISLAAWQIFRATVMIIAKAVLSTQADTTAVQAVSSSRCIGTHRICLDLLMRFK